MRFLFKYPKFLLLLLTFILTYVLLQGQASLWLQTWLLEWGYIGTFVAGVLYTYGFTAAPATAMLLLLGEEQPLWLAALIAGSGALVGDLIIFKFIRTSFAHELKLLAKAHAVVAVWRCIPLRLKRYMVPVLASILIASPLPDELGVTLMATSSISTKWFSLISYLLNTTGIVVILLLGRG